MKDPGLPPLPMRAAAGLDAGRRPAPKKHGAKPGNGYNDIPIHRGIANSATTESTEKQSSESPGSPSPALTQRDRTGAVTPRFLAASTHRASGKFAGQSWVVVAVSGKSSLSGYGWSAGSNS
jgi:hypothetical protein